MNQTLLRKSRGEISQIIMFNPNFTITRKKHTTWTLKLNLKMRVVCLCNLFNTIKVHEVWVKHYDLRDFSRSFVNRRLFQLKSSLIFLSNLQVWPRRSSTVMSKLSFSLVWMMLRLSCAFSRIASVLWDMIYKQKDIKKSLK